VLGPPPRLRARAAAQRGDGGRGFRGDSSRADRVPRASACSWGESR